MGESPKVSICRALLLGLAFFTTGLCISIIGPTLPDLTSQTKQKAIESTIIVVTSNSLGTIFGLILGSIFFKLINSYFTISITLFICSLITITIPFCSSIAAVTFVFLLQGISLGLIFRGVISQFYAYWKQRYEILIVFFLIFALGATFSPLITSSFVYTKELSSENVTSTVNSLPTTFMTHNVRKRQAFSTILSSSITISDCQNCTTDALSTNPVSTSNHRKSSATTSSVSLPRMAQSETTKAPNVTITTPIPLLSKSTKLSSKSTKISTMYSTLTSSTMTSTPGPNSIFNILNEVKKINNVKTAYVIVAMIAMLSALSYGFICCCTSCRWMRTPPIQYSDFPFKFKHTLSSKINFYAVATSTGYAFLIGSIEATLTSLLTVYCITTLHKPQSSGVLLTSVFWFTVAMSRCAALFFRKKFWQFIALLVVFCAAIMSCICMIVFSKSWVILWFSVATLGLSTGHLAPVGFCWLDQQLGLGPWYCTVWLTAMQFGRMIIPYLTAYGMTSEKSFLLPTVLIILISLSGMITFAFKKTVGKASQLTVVDKLVLTTNGEAFAYTKPVDYEDGMELDQLDEYTYFDRQKAVSYFVKQAPTASILK